MDDDYMYLESEPEGDEDTGEEAEVTPGKKNKPMTPVPWWAMLLFGADDMDMAGEDMPE